MATPDWALTIVYWLHMIATVLWIGGLAAMIFLVIPLGRDNLERSQAAKLQLKSLQRLNSLVWFSLIVLVGTGMLQLSSHPYYQGFLEVSNRWSIAILVKHLIILVMVLITAYITWSVTPELERVMLRNARKQRSNDDQTDGAQLDQTRKITRRATLLLSVNLILGISVLGLTALARVS